MIPQINTNLSSINFFSVIKENTITDIASKIFQGSFLTITSQSVFTIDHAIYLGIGISLVAFGFLLYKLFKRIYNPEILPVDTVQSPDLIIDTTQPEQNPFGTFIPVTPQFSPTNGLSAPRSVQFTSRFFEVPLN